MDRQTGGGVDPNTGLFVQGDPQQGVTGSKPHADWGNGVGEELRNLILEAGLTPDFNDWNQVRRSVAIMAARNQAMPNLLVNGGMEFWQRGFATVAAGQDKYTADRWFASPGSGSASILRIPPNSGGNPPEGMRNSMRFHQTAVAVLGQPKVLQRVEDISRLAGRTVTLSWYQRRITAFSVSVQLTMNFGQGGSANVIVGTETPATTPHDGDWERHEATFTVPAIGASTVGTDSFLEVAWLLPQNALFDWHFAQGQLEFGDVATSFEYIHPALELAICQRYFYSTYEHGVAPGTGTGHGAQVTHDEGFEIQGLQVRFPVDMRARPTTTFYSPFTGAAGKILAGGDKTVQGVQFPSTVASGYPLLGTQEPLQNMEAHVTADAEI